MIEYWWGRCKARGDGVIVRCTRQDMEEAAKVFDEVAAEFGLTVSVMKTKLVAGSNLEEGDLAPL